MVRRKLIRAAAERILSKAQVEDVPVPVSRIAKLAGVRVKKVPTEDELSGFLYTDTQSSTVIIGVNGSHSANRQHFTIAHELGHFFLHNFDDVHVDRSFHIKLRDKTSSEGTDIEEKEANLFAAELLMPVQMLESDIAELESIDLNDEDTIRDLARRYGVSTQAMMFRLAYLGYISI